MSMMASLNYDVSWGLHVMGGLCLVAIAVVFIAGGGCAHAQELEIRLLNGRNGHPISGTCVNVWVGRSRKEAMAIPTDEGGVARLHLIPEGGPDERRQPWSACGTFGTKDPTVKYGESLRINTTFVSCRPATADYSWARILDLPTKEVVERGFATANACGKATVTPHPGEVILFVRPLTWWEKFKM